MPMIVSKPKLQDFIFYNRKIMISLLIENQLEKHQEQILKINYGHYKTILIS